MEDGVTLFKQTVAVFMILRLFVSLTSARSQVCA